MIDPSAEDGGADIRPTHLWFDIETETIRAVERASQVLRRSALDEGVSVSISVSWLSGPRNEE